MQQRMSGNCKPQIQLVQDRQVVDVAYMPHRMSGLERLTNLCHNYASYTLQKWRDAVVCTRHWVWGQRRLEKVGGRQSTAVYNGGLVMMMMMTLSEDDLELRGPTTGGTRRWGVTTPLSPCKVVIVCVCVTACQFEALDNWGHDYASGDLARRFSTVGDTVWRHGEPWCRSLRETLSGSQYTVFRHLSHGVLRCMPLWKSGPRLSQSGQVHEGLDLTYG